MPYIQFFLVYLSFWLYLHISIWSVWVAGYLVTRLWRLCATVQWLQCQFELIHALVDLKHNYKHFNGDGLLLSVFYIKCVQWGWSIVILKNRSCKKDNIRHHEHVSQGSFYFFLESLILNCMYVFCSIVVDEWTVCHRNNNFKVKVSKYTCFRVTISVVNHVYARCLFHREQICNFLKQAFLSQN